MDVEIRYKNRKIFIEGKDDESVDKTSKILFELFELLDSGHLLDWDQFQYVVSRYKMMEMVKARELIISL